ncbi:MAG: preprotein translocase subunit YajC [Clostridiaceae bacterium]|jgi:preprotein translocase subunit YajC|nr:preprotein translocase subunit YajC [Clostridiaceae bacterium]
MQGQFATLISFVVMIGLFYLIIFVPEGRRKKKYNAMINSLKVNDEVVTKGGVMGKIVNIQDKFIILQSGPDRTRLKIDKYGVLSVFIETKEEVKKEEAKEEEK